MNGPLSVPLSASALDPSHLDLLSLVIPVSRKPCSR